MGAAPLAVVQESIMLRFGAGRKHSVSKSVAAGLFCGKAASFAASVLAEPLRRASPRAPFWAAFTCSLFSFLAAALYSRVQVDPDQDSVEDDQSKHAPLSIGEIIRLPKVFWTYMLICAAAGSWYTIIHLSTSLVQSAYGLTATTAAADASVILFASMPVRPTSSYPRYVLC